jgi:hypothetical protein
MNPRNAAWFLAAIMLLLSVLMGFHILSLWVGVSVCRDYADAILDPNVAVTGAEGVSARCGALQADLDAAVDKYLAVFLSLIGGSAVSGSYAATVTRKDDEP